MARSPKGRSAVGDEAARTLSEASSAGSGSGSSPVGGSASGSGGSSVTNAAAPVPANLPDVTYGKVLNVPDNLLGAGYTGKGWTIDEAVMDGGTPVIKLHRRVGNTGRIEEHRIDAETYARAKAYREKQSGMSKAVKPLVLTKADLGRALDPQGEMIPDTYDAGTRSYRVRLPGAREPQWISEDIIRDVKQGKNGALQTLRRAAGLDEVAGATTAGQAVAGAVASAILGKNFASRLGLANKDAEKALDRSSTTDSRPQSTTTQTREANRAANNQPEDRAARERQDRDQRLRRLNRRQAEEEQAEDSQPAPDRGAVAYHVTNTPGESSKVEVDASSSGAQAFSTTASTSKRRTAGGTRLTINETTEAPETEITDKPEQVEQTNVSDTSSNPQASYQTINRPLSATVPGTTSSPPSETTTSSRAPEPDRVQEALFRSEARRQRRQGMREKETLRGVVSSGAPQSLGTVEVATTESPSDIRQMRELMRAQAQDRHFTVTTGLNASVPNLQGGTGFSLPSSSGATGRIRGGSTASLVSVVAPTLAVAGAGAAQLMAGASSRASTLQAARGAAQMIVSMEGMRREEALQRIQSTREAVDLQIQAASQSLLQTSSASLASSVPAPLTPQDLSLLQQTAGTLRQAQASVSALAAGAIVPQGFRRTIAGAELLIEATASQVTDEARSDTGTEIQAVQQFASSFSPRQEAPLSQAEPTSMGASAAPSFAPSSSPFSTSADSVSPEVSPLASQGVRVGAPPVPRRRVSPPSSSGVGAQHVGGRGVLSAPLASVVNLNAAQARDQAAGSQIGGQDARTDTLSQDSSIPTDTNVQAPVTPRSAGFSPASSSLRQEDTEEAEDILSTPAEEAQKMREDADKTRATGEQFSGGRVGNASESARSPAEESNEPPPKTTGLSPQQQLTAAMQIGAAQQQKQQQEKEVKDALLRGTTRTSAAARPKSFQERLTKGKLLIDIFEGCFDGLGFLEFLCESTLGIANDKWFKLHSLPSLTGTQGGQMSRTDRALRRGVIVTDIYLAAVFFVGVCALVAIIVTVVGGISPTGTATPGTSATPGATPGIISWGLDS